MSSHTEVIEREKPVFWFTPAPKTDKSEYDRLVDEADNKLHLLTPNDSLYPFLRLKKLYLDKPSNSKVYVTKAVRKNWNTKDHFFVFVIEGQDESSVRGSPNKILDEDLKTFTNKSHHLWIESIAKTISGKFRRIGTLTEDHHNCVNLNVDLRKLLAERIESNSINPQLVHALEISKRKEDLLKDNEFIEAKDVARLLGSKAENVSSFAYNARSAGKIFSITDGRKRKYPLFQFDLERVEIRKEVALVLKELPESWTDWDVAFWFFQGNAYLDDRKPFELIKPEADEVISAAKYERDKLNG
jgi:hypothetical protein